MSKKKLIYGTQLLGSYIKKKDCFKILDFLFDNDIKDFDLAERYPYPEKNQTYGLSEKIFGEWLSNRNIKKEKLFIASKITGRNSGEIKKIDHKRLTKKSIIKSVNKILSRLKIDYLDLIYFHWPDRYTNNFFRKYYNPDSDKKFIKLEEQYEAIKVLKKEGKILNFGLCNETPWGIMKFKEIDRKENIFNFIQENYSILNREPEKSLKEIVLREKMNFFCYSPLAQGLLNEMINLKKLKKYKNKRIYSNPKIIKKISQTNQLEKYEKLKFICQKKNLNIFEVSLAFLKNSNFLNGIIFGSKDINQVKDFLNLWNFNSIKKNDMEFILNFIELNR